MIVGEKIIHNLLIMVAMEVEEEEIFHFASFERLTISSVFKIEAQICHAPAGNIILVRCGVGGVNAATALTLIREKFEIDAVVLTGVGGAIVPSLDIGELVLSDAVIQHDSFSSVDEGMLHIAPGELHLLTESDKWKDIRMTADPDLHSFLASRLAGHKEIKVKTGTVVSGAEFVGTSARKLALSESHAGSLLVDMEAAAIAQLSRRLGLPYIVAKTVADRVNSDGSISTEFEKFVRSAAHNSGVVFTSFLDALKE